MHLHKLCMSNTPFWGKLHLKCSYLFFANLVCVQFTAENGVQVEHNIYVLAKSYFYTFEFSTSCVRLPRLQITSRIGSLLPAYITLKSVLTKEALSEFFPHYILCVRYSSKQFRVFFLLLKRTLIIVSNSTRMLSLFNGVYHENNDMVVISLAFLSRVVNELRKCVR